MSVGVFPGRRNEQSNQSSLPHERGGVSGVWKIVDKEITGVFNIAGSDRASVYGLVLKAAEIFGYDPALVKPVRQGYFNEFTRRPRDTSFDTGKMRTVLGILPLSIDEGIKKMKETQV